MQFVSLIWNFHFSRNPPQRRAVGRIRRALLQYTFNLHVWLLINPAEMFYFSARHQTMWHLVVYFAPVKWIDVMSPGSCCQLFFLFSVVTTQDEILLKEISHKRTGRMQQGFHCLPLHGLLNVSWSCCGAGGVWTHAASSLVLTRPATGWSGWLWVFLQPVARWFDPGSC